MYYIDQNKRGFIFLNTSLTVHAVYYLNFLSNSLYTLVIESFMTTYIENTRKIREKNKKNTIQQKVSHIHYPQLPTQPKNFVHFSN